MTLMKSLMLGSAAGIVAVASAQAADLPTRKAAPVEYVRVCNVGGITGWTLPGSDTCVKLSGYVTAHIIAGNLSNQYNSAGAITSAIDAAVDPFASPHLFQVLMIQGGDPNSKDPAKENSYGEGGPGYNIKAEFNDHSHDRGVISMARGPDPDSAGSQFFICLEATPHLDRQYTAFGRTADTASLAVVKAIGNVKTGDNDRPSTPVTIKTAKVIEMAK